MSSFRRLLVKLLHVVVLLVPLAIFAQQRTVATYDPANWISEILLPQKAGLTLKDIVIPGSHDAGMSVLTATGGIQSSTINECNTVTQVYPIAQQLEQGLRFFDLRIGKLNGDLYTKHCSSDCMEDAMGGGYGESLTGIAQSIRNFLADHEKEFILLSFTHFCDKEITPVQLATWLTDSIGKKYLFEASSNTTIGTIPLTQLSGKVLLLFERTTVFPSVFSCSFEANGPAFVNFNRLYAASNKPKVLLARQKKFFQQLLSGTQKNDIVRLDWQLTQSSDEAAMICNDFQSEHTGLGLDMAMLMTNIVRGHKSIITLSHKNNKRLAPTVNDWIADGTISKINKPNILLVDVAGKWVTDFCVQLNNSSIYQATISVKLPK